MLYKCSTCKTSKSFDHPGPSETAHCVVCQRTTRFLPESSGLSSAFTPRRERSMVGLGRPAATASTIRPCDYFKLCLEYLLSLEYSKRLFNRKNNRCYCENCYGSEKRDFTVQGGCKYVIPRGWVRFGLYVDDAQAEAEDIWNKWVVTYHGTKPESAKSIIAHHSFLLPGDQCITGSVIRICDGHIPDQIKIYTSPSIAYSGDDIYAPGNRFRSASGRVYQAKVVLQCRQKPGTYKIQGETIGATRQSIRICPTIPNTELEYFTQARATIIPYGLLIRVY